MPAEKMVGQKVTDKKDSAFTYLKFSW